LNINKKHIQNIKTLIDSNRINRALRKIQWSVLKIISDNRFTAVLYDSPELDLLCEEIGKRVKRKILNSDPPSPDNITQHSAVIVCSRLQVTGGHTRVIEDFVRLLPNKDVLVLVTEVPARSNRRHVSRRLTGLGASVEWCKKGNLEKRLYWLEKRLLSANPKDIFLFNHHEDSVAVAGMQMAKEAKVHFYHHGDHHLSLGIHLTNAEHIDIHAFGYENCRNKLGINENTYFPLVAEDRGTRPDSIEFMSNGHVVTCTAAGKNKVENKHDGPYYIDVISRLLTVTKGQHIHMGKLSWVARFRIRQAIQRSGLKQSTFIYIPWVQNVWNALHEHNVDIYLSSFPITGGRTLIEAMGSGIPVVLYNNPESRLLSGVDLVYPDAFIWIEESNLLDYLQSLTPEKLLAESKLARDYFLRHYRDELLREALTKKASHHPPPPRRMNTRRSELPGTSPFSKQNTDRIISLKTKTYFSLKYLRSIISNLVFR
jgi:glycosyltransferase involved in cell wall biosynthesis